jgi:hypothetical protein
MHSILLQLKFYYKIPTHIFFRPRCYMQEMKILSNCCIQSCTPWWWVVEAPKHGTGWCFVVLFSLQWNVIHLFMWILIITFVSTIKNDLHKLKHLSIMKNVFFIKLPTAKLMHDNEYLAVTYWQMVHNYLGTNKGGIFQCSSVRRLRFLDLTILV